MRWVAFGTYDVTRHPRVGVLIEGLRASGDDVVEVNEPLRLDTAGRVAMLRQPWRLPLLAGKLLRCWTILWRRGRRRRPDAVLVGYLGHFDVRLARRLFRGTPLVLDHLVSASGTARDRSLAGTGGVKARLLTAIDAGALSRSAVIVVDTDEHLAELPASERAKGVVAPVGAGAEFFAVGAARTPPHPGALRVIFVGVFTPLHGTATLGAALAGLDGDDIDVTMVGTGQEYIECRRAAAGNHRVRWVDWVHSTDLPGLVAAHDVSLGIFGTSPKALAVVPTKVYQGAAAACAIVTSDTPPQRSALGDAAVFVPPGDAPALAAALRTLAKDRAETARLGRAAYDVATARYTASAVVEPVRSRVFEVA